MWKIYQIEYIWTRDVNISLTSGETISELFKTIYINIFVSKDDKTCL